MDHDNKGDNNKSGWNVAEEYLSKLMLCNLTLYNSLMINENYEGSFRIMQQLINNFSPYLMTKKKEKKDFYIKLIDDKMKEAENNIFSSKRFQKDIENKRSYQNDLAKGVSLLNETHRLLFECMNICGTLLPMSRKLGIQEQIGSS